MRLLPHEDATQYETEPHPDQPGALMLAHKPNGECVYLGKTGCTIHERAPRQCRTMDCRTIFHKLHFVQALAMMRTGEMNLDVWRRGRDLTKATRKRG